MSDKNKFMAHIGLGYWGENIFKNLYELGILHTAYDADQHIINKRKDQFPELLF